MKKYLYYPGCSLKGTGKAYEESLIPVFKMLDAELKEIDDWNCCGATAYMSVDELKAFALAARNLAIAEKEGGSDLVAPCAACYLVLNKAQQYMREYPSERHEVSKALKGVGLTYSDTIKVRHPLDVLINDIGFKEISSKVKKTLKGLKIAPYYGCQIVRPYATFDDQYNPTTMDDLVKACGAEVVYYPLKTRCCGGSLTGTIPEVGVRLAYILLREARKRGADMLVTACPLCQFNLDGYQDQMKRRYEEMSMPILYFTQILGLAFGIPAKELGFRRSIISAHHALDMRGITHV
jgi:heterodisulfide reductase subunit B